MSVHVQEDLNLEVPLPPRVSPVLLGNAIHHNSPTTMTRKLNYDRPPSPYPVEVRIDPHHEKRVVDVLPGAGNSKIHCRISAQPLDSSGDYEALSYAWGAWAALPSEPCPTTIRLNDIPDYPVTPNLLDALQRLRHPTHPRRMWIDQMCINQVDHDEKGVQIWKISQVFANATKVIVWLGDAADKDSLTSRDKVPAALKTVLKNEMVEPWWERAWVIEEFALAKGERVAMFGPFEWEWDGLIRLLETSKTWWPHSRVHVIEAQLALFKDMSAGPPRSLHHHSVLLAHTKTKNPQDKVLCIVTSLSDAEAGIIRQARGRGVSEVFAQATYASIAASGSLGILGLCPRYSSRRRLRTTTAATTAETPPTSQIPSWAVDFTFEEGLPLHLPTGPSRRVTEAGHRITHSMFKLPRWIQTTGLYHVFDFATGERKRWCQTRPRDRAEVSFQPGSHRLLHLTALAFDAVEQVSVVKDIGETLGGGGGRTAAGSSGSFGDRLKTYVKQGVVFNAQNTIALWGINSTSRLLGQFDDLLLDDQERKVKAAMERKIAGSGSPYTRIGGGASSAAAPKIKNSNDKSDNTGSWAQGRLRITMIFALMRIWDQLARPPNAKRKQSLLPLVMTVILSEPPSDDEPALLSSVKGVLKERLGVETNEMLDEDMSRLFREVGFLMLLLLHVKGASVFMTRAGFIGIGPADLGADDVVVLPYGSRYPIALRPSSVKGQWNYLGFVFVHGIMDNELWDCFENIQMEERVYTLV